MIGFLRGILADKGDGYIIIDVNGVGYQVFVPANSTAYLNAEGEEVLVYTSMIVREDDVSLFGFSGKGELDAFRKLIGVSGVGPKAAISILSSFTLDQFKQAIVFEDSKSLQRANGIGKKTAERIVLELKDKFSAGRKERSDKRSRCSRLFERRGDKRSGINCGKGSYDGRVYQARAEESVLTDTA